MGSWGKILTEVKESADARGGSPDLDGIRLKYIERIRALNGHAVIVYASGFLNMDSVNPLAAVHAGDVHALMEVCHQVEDEKLDLIIHSPGGSGQAAEQIVNYLRTQFEEITAYVPLQAKSAATMIAFGCDEIVMGRHSELGPIDPQILIPVPEGSRFAPAHAIVRDFERAKREIAADVNALPAWTPILRTYAGGLLEFCQQQILLAQEVVAGWVEKYMLAHEDAGVPEQEREDRAREIAEYFGSAEAYERFRTHGRPVRIEELQKLKGVRVRELEDENQLQDAVLSLYHALDITFGGPAIKIVENHLGARHVRAAHQIVVQPMQPDLPGQPSDPIPTAPGIPPAPPPNRAERRRQKRARDR